MDRSLGIFERFYITRKKLGYPAVVVFLATIQAEIDPQKLADAIKILQEKYPILSCTITDLNTRYPKFKLQSSSVESVLKVAPLGNVTDDDLLLEGQAEGERTDWENGPFWGVTLYQEQNLSKVLFQITHVVNDGTGTRNLFAELLQLAKNPLSGDIKPIITPKIENKVDTSPSLFFLLAFLFLEKIVPMFPGFIQNLFKYTYNFPPLPPMPPKEFPTTHGPILKIKSETIRALKEQGHQNGVHSLHPILNVAACYAINKCSGQFTGFSTVTPVNLRGLEESIPQTGGNFVGIVPIPVMLNDRTSFWDQAKRFAKTFEANKHHAQNACGLLLLLPDPPVETSEPLTGWETHFGEVISRRESHGESIEMSNLTVLPTTGWEEQGLDVAWLQNCWPGSAAFMINVISVAGGDLTITTTYRKGVIPKSVEENFEKHLVSFLENLMK